MIFLFALALHFSLPEIHSIIAQEAREHKVPVSLALRLAFNESQFSPVAMGCNKDKYGQVNSIDLGLFQLNSKCVQWFMDRFPAPELGEDLANPRLNAHLGLSYLRSLYELSGSWAGAVKGYNCGPSTVIMGMVSERTERYAARIAREYGLARGILYVNATEA